MGLFPAKSAQTIVDSILKEYGEEAKILILAAVSITLPLLEEE
jgi:hypothetical protein